MTALSDPDLVRAAQSGDAGAFAVLIQRHLPGMRAVAIAVLGHADEADDAVQDAVLTALRQLSQLRDPAAAGAWLKAIVRNNCRMSLRARRPIPIADPEPLLPPDAGSGPEGAWEDTDVQNWVRHAVASLSDPVREVTLLRYFTGFSSYQQIADLCGLPIGTVRSRLRVGRRVLAQTLRETAEAEHRESGAAAASRQEAEATLAAGLRGDYARMVHDRFHPDATVMLEGRAIGDRTAVIELMDASMGDGVRMHLHEAVASRDVMVWETRFINPLSDPDHCPPTMVWLQALRQGRVQRVHLAYGRPESQQDSLAGANFAGG